MESVQEQRIFFVLFTGHGTEPAAGVYDGSHAVQWHCLLHGGLPHGLGILPHILGSRGLKQLVPQLTVQVGSY